MSQDKSQEQVFVQRGTIFYSPNCPRPVLVPEEQDRNDPFEASMLNVEMFKQPTWWSDRDGWLSFVPLAPCYISAPFEQFCWMPRIEEVTVRVSASEQIYETRHQMAWSDIFAWHQAEKVIADTTLILRLRHKIPGRSPPLPSHFHYDRPHKTHALAKKMIGLARDWFSIWMGFMSYTIAQTSRLPMDTNSMISFLKPFDQDIQGNVCHKTAEIDEGDAQDIPLPSWYIYLRDKHQYSEFWLDGLSLSSVCSYKPETCRAGVIIQLTEDDILHPPVEWFIAHHTPVFLVWTNMEERYISRNPSLSYLQPPPHLLQEALTLLFREPDLPLASLIISQYYNKKNVEVDEELKKFLDLHCAPSFVHEFTLKQISRQKNATVKPTQEYLHPYLLARDKEQKAAAETALTAFTVRPMIKTSDSDQKGRLFNDWRDFFDRRNLRHQEIASLATPIQRQSWESRSKNPGLRNAAVYVWVKNLSSKGRPMYMHVCMTNKQKEGAFASYSQREKIYNSIDNEWDMCSDFDFGGDSPLNPDSNTWSATEDCETCYDIGQYQTNPSNSSPDNGSTQEVLSMEIKNMTRENIEDNFSQEPLFSRDLLEMLHYGYGYVPSIPGILMKACPALEMKAVFNTFGLHLNLSELDVPPQEHSQIKHFLSSLLSSPSSPLPLDIHDLNDKNHLALSHLVDFPAIIRSPENLFIFYAPRSQACDWLLGVHSPSVALYVCQLIISNPSAHNIVTVAKRLLEKGIQFRTLLGLSCNSSTVTITDPYHATSFRPSGYHFTPQDFETAMLQCQSIIATPQGRAALLRGGIIGRIAREYSSLDGILNGPSPEVTAHQRGYITPSSAPHCMYCDDELTEQELAIICGTYSVYTPYKGQESVKSWFPPAHVWDAHQNGLKWVEWTERAESFYRKRRDEIHNHGGQPLTVIEWRSRMKGHKNIRTLYENNNVRASVFLDRTLPKEKLFYA